MDIEKVSNVNSNYNATESVKAVSAPEEIAPANVHVEQKDAVAGKNEKAEGEREHKPSEATIDDAVKSANRRMEHTRCEYSYHKKTNRVSIKVLDADTNEVIREIPPEKSLDMLQKMWEMAGILVDERR